jgi:adenosylcobinamide-phosphate synthase
MYNMAVIIMSSYIADLVFGDPEWLPHPVRIMGNMINFLDRSLNTAGTARQSRLRGCVMTCAVVVSSMFFAYLAIFAAGKIHPFLGLAASVYFGYASLAVKDLRLKTASVHKALSEGSLESSRRKLSKIVGRDTEILTEEKIVTAAIESVAESTSDGIVAPLFYLVIGGPVLAIGYKAVNTLDSMVGHKDERYGDFGWSSARLDDAANYLPARITGLLIVAASCILRKDFRQAFKIMRRDSRQHASPNSGVSEAAMAGALGIRLGGASTYQGEVVDKPYIGEPVAAVRPGLILQSLNISFAVSLMAVLIGAGFRWAL